MTHKKKFCIPFGTRGFKSLIKEVEGTETKTWEVILDWWVKDLKERGFRKIGRGRAVFEEALDWQAKFEGERILRAFKNKKVPKNLCYSIREDLPKVE